MRLSHRMDDEYRHINIHLRYESLILVFMISVASVFMYESFKAFVLGVYYGLHHPELEHGGDGGKRCFKFCEHTQSHAPLFFFCSSIV